MRTVCANFDSYANTPLTAGRFDETRSRWRHDFRGWTIARGSAPLAFDTPRPPDAADGAAPSQGKALGMPVEEGGGEAESESVDDGDKELN